MPDSQVNSDLSKRDAYRDLVRAVEMQRLDRAVHLISAIQRGDHEQEAEIVRLRAENERVRTTMQADIDALAFELEEARRLLANATDPENAGDWDEAREVGWAHVAEWDRAQEEEETR